MNIYQAINAVQKELAVGGIGKTRKNQQQGYQFRGIDDIYNAVSSLLGKHGLCILPRVLTRECVERQTKNGGALFYVTVEVEFDFISAEDGSKHTVKTFGEAMDSADKATNKAMSAAYKYAVMQTFAIPTEGDNDADATTHEVAPPANPPTRPATPATPAPPANPVPENDRLDLMAAIEGAASLEELKPIFGSAVAVAKRHNDNAAMAEFIAAKEVRKSEITAQQRRAA
jgi:hypothetical protein